MFLLTEYKTTRAVGMLKERPKSGMYTIYKNALWWNGISWIGTSLTKLFESGKRDFEFVWLQEKDSLNIRCENFALLAFCRVLFLRGRLFDCLLVD